MEKTVGISKYIHIKVEADFHRLLKTHCAGLEKKMKEFAIEALTEKMANDRKSQAQARAAAKAAKP